MYQQQQVHQQRDGVASRSVVGSRNIPGLNHYTIEVTGLSEESILNASKMVLKRKESKWVSWRQQQQAAFHCNTAVTVATAAGVSAVAGTSAA